MGYLAGLRDFIETAELDRMKVLAKDHPDMFYHILPYSMVFGLFDLYAKKLDALKLPAPDWYVYGGSDPYFHYYMMGHYMDHVVSENLTVVEPSESGGVGEFFSGGDGGFSGGGWRRRRRQLVDRSYKLSGDALSLDSHVADTKSDCG